MVLFGDRRRRFIRAILARERLRSEKTDCSLGRYPGFYFGEEKRGTSFESTFNGQADFVFAEARKVDVIVANQEVGDFGLPDTPAISLKSAHCWRNERMTVLIDQLDSIMAFPGLDGIEPNPHSHGESGMPDRYRGRENSIEDSDDA